MQIGAAILVFAAGMNAQAALQAWVDHDRREGFRCLAYFVAALVVAALAVTR